ncbi:MAG: hypothetical protein ACOYL6_16485 [Bacteriovoracaceae bacterium]
MRQQAQFIHNNGPWEMGAAIGMAGNNPGVTADFSWITEYTHYNTSALIGADMHTSNTNTAETGIVLKL